MGFLNRRFFAAMLAEFMGAMFYIMFGCMGIVYATNNFVVGINFGLLILVAIQLFHAISGAHVNPCVTIAALIIGETKWQMCIGYFICQFLGNLFGYFAATSLVPAKLPMSSGFCITTPAMGVTALMAFFLELLLTAGWMYGICATWDQRNRQFRDSMGLRVGFIVGALIVSGANFTGGSLNPYRTLVPAVFTGVYTDIWAYMAGPLLAAILIPLEWRFLYGVPYDGNRESGGNAA